jgi:hypothetical protein
MKKLLMVVMIAILAMGSCFAQPGGGDPAARLQRDLNDLTTALGLTKDQVAKITPIVTEGNKKSSEMFQKMREGGGTPDREKMMAESAKIRTETDTKIKAVLTAEQGPKLDAFRKTQAEERAKRMQNR